MHDRLRWWNEYESNACLCKKTHKRKFEKKIRKNLIYSQWKHATWPKLVSLLLIILGEGTFCYNNAACIIGTYNLPFLLAVSKIHVFWYRKSVYLIRYNRLSFKLTGKQLGFVICVISAIISLSKSNIFSQEDLFLMKLNFVIYMQLILFKIFLKV